MKSLLYFIFFSVVSQLTYANESCSSVLKTTKYKVQSGEHIAFILREFKLEPVFGSFGSLNKLLKINQIENQNLIEPQDEITLPFECEEQISKWKTIDRKKDRLITKNINSKTNILNFELNTAEEPPSDIGSMDVSKNVVELKIIKNNSMYNEDQKEDKKLNEILKSNIDQMPIEKNQTTVPDVELQNKIPEEISEALRYRMICEGEWTGTQCITRYSTLFIAGSGWFNRYDGVDPVAPGGTNNEGLLLSRFNPQVQVGWQNYWTENFKTEISAGLQNSEILPEAREIPIEQDKKLLSQIYVQARYESGDLGIGLGIKNYDKLFYRFRFSGLSAPCLSNNSSFSGCGVFVHSANILSYFVNLNWIFYQQGKFTYDGKVTLSYLGSGATGGFEVYMGTGTSVELTVKHDRVQEYLFGTIHYGLTSQNTSIEVQKAQDLGFVFGYAWKLKDW